MKFLSLLFIMFFIISCQYPDIDNVPDFNNISLSDEEIMDYCSNLDTDQTNLEKCITDLKNKNYE